MRFLKQNIFFWLFLALICFGLGRLFSYLEQNSINKRKITDGIQLEVQSKVEESRKLLNSFITNNPEKSLIKNISFYNSVIVLEKRPRPKIVPLEVNYPKNES